MKDSVIVHGPQGSGKTSYAPAIAQHFGLNRIIEWGDWDTNQELPKEGALILTNDPDLIPRPLYGRRLQAYAIDYLIRKLRLTEKELAQ